MNQTEKRQYLIRRLLSEQPRYRNIEIPEEIQSQTICIDGDIGQVMEDLRFM